MVERIFNIVLRAGKNFGYFALGCSVIGFIEIGVYAPMVFAFVASLFVIAMSYIALRQMEHNEKWIGRKFISMVLKRHIKKDEVEEFDDILDRIGDEVWDLCATEEDKERIQGGGKI